jgi:ubiquinol-cytochrome c reductase cytochrome b subunit
VLERPRNVPVRTGIGVAGALFYGILWGAASADVVAITFGVSFELVIATLQVALIVGPPLAFAVTRRIASGLQRKDRDIVLRGYETGRVIRTSEGGYVGVRAPADATTRALLTTTPVTATPVRPDRHGRLPVRQRVRGLLDRGFAQGHVRPESHRLPEGEAAAGIAARTQPAREKAPQLRA